MGDERTLGDWQRRRLGTVAEFKNGRAFGPDDWGASGLPIIRIQNLNSTEADWNYFDGPVGEAHYVSSGDLLLSWSASLDVYRWRRGPAVLNQHIFKVLAMPNVADDSFLYHALKGIMAIVRSKVHGSTMQHVTKRTFEALSVAVPPLAEQRRIAAILDAIDAAIERTQAVIDAVEHLRKALLQQVLTRGMPSWHTEYKDVPGVGTIPADWDVVKLRDVIDSSVYGPRFPASCYDPHGNVATLRTTDISDEGGISYHTMPLASLDLDGFKQFMLTEGDVVVTRSGSCGIAAIFEQRSQVPVLPGAFLIRLQFAELDLARFVGLWLNSQNGRAATSRIEAGGVQKNLNAENLKRIQIPLPHDKEREAIMRLAATFAATLETERKFAEVTAQLKSSTADALLSGRVRVPLTTEVAG